MDANSDYVSVADNDQLDAGSGDFTIECWAYVRDIQTTIQDFCQKRCNGANH